MAEENEKDQGQRPGGDSPGPGNGDAAAKSADADVGRVVPDPPKPPPRGGDQKKVVPDPPKPPPRPGAPKKAVPDPPKPPPRPGGSKTGVPDPPKPPPRRAAPSARAAGGEGSADKPAVPRPPPTKPTAPAKPKGPVNEQWSAPLVDAVREKFPDQVLDAYTFLSQRQLVIKKDRFTEIMEFLRRNDVEPFDFLSDETATHWPNEEEFELVYSLFSFETKGRLCVKLRIKEWESVESLTGIWQGADWLEREVYDMYGVRYVNHPNLKRILLPEDWTGFPLRKDYDLRLQDVEWVRKHLGIDSGQKFYVGKAKHED